MSGLIFLPERAAVAVRGAEAAAFLHGICTNNIETLAEGDAAYAGLLTPQGKLLFDFFVLRQSEGFLVDISRALAADFVKRLTFYKLRAKVEIGLLAQARVFAVLKLGRTTVPNATVFADPRHAEAGARVIAVQPTPEQEAIAADEDAWLQHRVALCLPEGGRDFAYGDCFPHDIAMDQLNGIAFAKGCYVGQEVVSRMKHRGTARRRPMIAAAAAPLPMPPCDILADGKTVGTIGSVAGARGLAIVRLDFAEEALATSKGLRAGESELALQRPLWASYGEAFPVATG